MSNDKSLGQIAFEAYGDNREWKDWRGQPMPQWGDVREEIRVAWQVAAEAAVKAHYASRDAMQDSKP
jgi:hypothetical protein